MKINRLSLLGALLICSTVSHAVECTMPTVADTPYTVCRVDLTVEQLELFWKDEAGRPYRQFSVLHEALTLKAKQLVFAVNAGMYRLGVEIEGCARCGGQLKIIASIEEAQLIAKILSHLERAAPEQYQSELPLGARGPPVQSRLL